MDIPSETSLTASLTERLHVVQQRIADATARAGREPGAVTLIAVSKTHPAESIAAALAAGQTRFGENRVQEAAAKFPALRDTHPSLRLHLIGGLQTNKARDAVRIADVIESLDRPRLADAIAAAIASEGRSPELLVQINVGDEPQKAGIPRADADRFIEECQQRFGAALTGLMCIPPPRPTRRRILPGSPAAPIIMAFRRCRWACPVISRPRSCTAPPMSASAAPFSALAQPRHSSLTIAALPERYAAD